jgi:hypothetical protein
LFDSPHAGLKTRSLRSGTGAANDGSLLATPDQSGGA